MNTYDWEVVDVDPGVALDDARRELGSAPPGEASDAGRFPGRAEAEEYLGANWRRLASSGVRSVRLMRGETTGPVVTLEAGE